MAVAMVEITRRNRGVKFTQVIAELNSFFRGWVAYYRFAHCRVDLQLLDHWVRRKLRCYRLKQCKSPKSVARFLKRLGVSAVAAYRIAASGKGWWRLSLTHAVHLAMSTE